MGSWERDFDSGKPKDKTSEKQQEEYSSRGNSRYKSPEAKEECQRRHPGKEGTICSESERKARGEGIPARRIKVGKGTRV